MSESIRAFTESARFQNAIVALILLTGALAGIETYLGAGARLHPAVDLAQNVILGFFVVEMALKLLACGTRPWDYFRSGWNVFDFLIVAVCLLPLDAGFSSVLRMARLVRTLRLVAILPRLQTLVGALLRSIPSLGYIGVLLGLHLYMYAVLGTFLFRGNDPYHFGRLHDSVFTLFQVLTLEGWNDIMAIQYFGSDLMYDEGMKALFGAARASEAHPLIAALYFVSFILLGTMILLNLFTGVIITSMEEASNETAEERRQQHLHDGGAATLRDELDHVGRKLKELAAQLETLKTPDD